MFGLTITLGQHFLLRFAFIEEALEKQGRKVGDASLDEKNRLWDEAKRGGR